MAGGVYIAGKALRESDVKDSGKPPRHSRGGEASVRDAIKLVLAVIFGLLCGGATLWWGINDGLLSLVGLGIAALALSVLAIPYALSALKWLLTRRK